MSTSLTITTTLIIINRFKSVNSGSFARIFDFGTGGQAGSLCVTVNRETSNKLGYYVFSTDGSKVVWQSTDLVVNDGVWRHLVWTIETDGRWTMYINGRVYTDVSKNTAWVFPNSNGVWYSPVPSGYQTKWSSTGIVSNSNMTVSFTIKISETSAVFRNIFHVTNTDAECCNIGDRVPAVYIMFQHATSLYISSSTTSNGDCRKGTGALPLNQEVNVDLVWSDRTLYVYYNGLLDTEFLLDNIIVAANANADLLIANSWWAQGGFQIKDLKIVNGVAVRHVYPSSIFRPTAWLVRSENGDSPYNGYLDDFRIYSTVLAPTAVAALYNYSAPSGTTNYTTTIIID